MRALIGEVTFKVRRMRDCIAAAIMIVSAFLLAACAGGSAVLSAAGGPAQYASDGTGPLTEGKGRFLFADWGGRSIPVWTYVPTQSNAAELPIAVIMHGAGRDGDRYRDEWAALAQVNRFIVIAPEFSSQAFPKAERYNLGNVFNADSARVDESEWTFSAIEPLFSAVTRHLNSTQTTYTIYGHSAGSQFVHRFLLYKPEARVNRYIAANAGWYTMPNFDEPYPYGLNGAGVDPDALKIALQRDVVILLGDLDNDPMHRSLRRAPEAMRQGPYRLARGRQFFERARQIAEDMDTPFNWRLQTAPYAKHSNGEMALFAAALVGAADKAGRESDVAHSCKAAPETAALTPGTPGAVKCGRGMTRSNQIIGR